MRIWIGVILFSFLITTKQQTQNLELNGENEDALFDVPSPKPIFSILNPAVVLVESISSTSSSSNDGILKATEIPTTASIVTEQIKTLDTTPQSDIPAPLSEDLSLSSAEEISAAIKSEELISEDTVVGDRLAPNLDVDVATPNLNPEQQISEHESLDKISIIIEQDVVVPLLSEPDDITSKVENIFTPETGDHDKISLETTASDIIGIPKDEVKQILEQKVLDEIHEKSKEANKSEEDSIPSFSEWTKLQLAQRKESIINNIKDKTPLQEGKNFASPDCGAKVVASNPEAQNPSGIISSSHDEYMLNRCTVNTWLVVELCEPLRVEKVALGNLELFSSSPNEFELGVTDRYPSRDWTTIGPFFAPAFRNLHSFQLPSNDTAFGKFLRVVVKSHHGKEHYCPLSLIKVFGKSEYEVLESETTHAEDVEQSNSNSNSVMEEETNGHDAPATQSVLGSATEAVIQMVKKAASALVYNGSEIETPTSTSTTTNLSCFTITQCIPEVMHKDEIFHNLSCKSNLLKWLQQILSWCGWEYCHEFIKTRSVGSPWMTEGMLIALYGPPIMDSLCNYIKPINSCDLHEDELVVQLTSGVPNDTQSNEAEQKPTPAIPIVPLQTNEQQQHQPSEVLPSPQVNPPLITEEPAQKESVFVRLSNRIKNLERNQSLSSGYLEELSRRFKKQSEELSITHDIFRKTLNESMSKCKSVEENLRYYVKRLSRNNENLRELVWRVELQRGGMVFFSIVQLICTIIFWWRSQRRIGGVPVIKISETTDKIVTNSQSEFGSSVLVSQRKRTNSEQLKKVRKKKKKNEGGCMSTVANSSNGGLKFDFKTPNILEPGSNTNSSTSISSMSMSIVPNVPNKSDRSTSGQSNISCSHDQFHPAIKKKSKFMSLNFFGNKN